MPIKTVKKTIRASYNEWLFQRAFANIRKLRSGETPRRTDIENLQVGWGNSGWSGDSAFLQAACWLASGCDGPILECGSGLSTLVLAAIPRKPAAKLYSLEHISEWQQRVAGKLHELDLEATVVHTPMKRFDAYDWYDVPDTLPTRFSLVICDGPPSQTRGGRYGLLPSMHEKIASAIILLDDAERDAEQLMIEQWKKEWGYVTHYSRSGEGAIAIMLPTEAK